MRNTFIPVYIQTHIQNLETKPISQKRYEIERKCKWKLDSKSCMGSRMVKIFLTSKGQGQGQTLETLKSHISKTVRDRESVNRS